MKGLPGLAAPICLREATNNMLISGQTGHIKKLTIALRPQYGNTFSNNCGILLVIYKLISIVHSLARNHPIKSSNLHRLDN